MKNEIRIAIGVATSLMFATAYAHHSFTMFDFKRDVILDGTVKEFEWSNPHCFIQLIVPTTDGSEEWSIEMTSPLHLLQNGWGPHLVRAGDRLRVRIHPMRDGSSRGGSYVLATTTDGTPIDPHSLSKSTVAAKETHP
jgi:hypothetical protein